MTTSLRVFSYGPKRRYVLEEHCDRETNTCTYYYFTLYDTDDQGNLITAFMGPRIEVRAVEGPLSGRILVAEDGVVFSELTKKRLIPTRSKAGYDTIATHVGGRRHGKAITVRIHRLVAKAFIPNPHRKPYVNHLDGIKINNHRTNLEWVTNQENVIHAYKTGLIIPQCGTEATFSKIKDPDTVRYIRAMRGKIPRRKLAKQLGISDSIIARIYYRNCYSSVV